jgi:phosphonate transport system permease protein
VASLVPSLPEQQAHELGLHYEKTLALRRRQLWLGVFLLAAAVLVASRTAEVDLPRLFANIDKLGVYFYRLAHLDNGQPVWTDLREWLWGVPKWSAKLLETLLIAYVGTVVGAAGALLGCFLASENLGVTPWVRILTRRILEFCRTVPEIVFALIFVVAFGLGPLAGILALAIHTGGALGKLFAEVVENIDLKPFDGLKSAGASWVQSVRFAVLPQVIPGFLSYGLLRFEINVRGAAVMGFVGAGGIGQDLLEAVRKFYYSDVSAMLLMIVLTVVVIDLATERVRHRLLARETT